MPAAEPHGSAAILCACGSPRQRGPPMRRSTTGQMVEEVRGEGAGVSLNDLHVRRTGVILKVP
jgi:hypothetical protein